MKRIQRKRTKGWRMPENTVYVGRGSKWGNPFKIGENIRPTMQLKTSILVVDNKHAVKLYKRFLSLKLRTEAKRELKGKNLSCWCKKNKPCHADVLLKIANDI